MDAKSKMPTLMLKKNLKWVLGGLGLVFLLCASVRFEKLDQKQAQMKASLFDAAAYARDFWDVGLPGVLTQSLEAQSLIPLFNTDMDAAIKQGQTLGESRVHAYLLQGCGTLVAMDQKGMALRLDDSDSGATVRVLTGRYISGNAIRDASGLVNVSDFSDTLKFNKISSHINKIVVAEVIEPFLETAPESGQQVTFVGAAEVAEDATEQTPFGSKDTHGKDHLLSLVPIRLTLK